MALPHETTSAAFSADQQVTFRASYWDTPFTAPSEGIEYAAFELLGTLPSCSTVEEWEAVLNSGLVRPVLGSEDGQYRTGRVPNVYQYWGTGAPDGVGTARRVVLKFSGTVQPWRWLDFPGHTMVLGGQGTVHVFRTSMDGAGEVRTTAVLREPSESSSGLVPVQAYEPGDRLDIYYVQDGEPWGGIVAKLVPSDEITPVAMSDDGVLGSMARPPASMGVSPVLSASMLSAGPAAERPLPYLLSGDIAADVGGVRELKLRVALGNAGTGSGYRPVGTGEGLHLVDNATGERVRPGRRLAFHAGYITGLDAAGDPVVEEYPRFTGYIESIAPDARGETAEIVCKGFDGRMTEVFDEALPDRMSYIAAGYTDLEYRGNPVYNVPAYDAWPLEVAIADLCHRAGIDAGHLLRVLATVLGRPERYRLAERRPFSARRLIDTAEPIRLERRSRYGNVGPGRRDTLPADEPYIFQSDISQRLYDRARSLAEHLGYDFGFDGLGSAYILPRNNPSRFEVIPQGEPTEEPEPVTYPDFPPVNAYGDWDWDPAVDPNPWDWFNANFDYDRFYIELHDPATMSLPWYFVQNVETLWDDGYFLPGAVTYGQYANALGSSSVENPANYRAVAPAAIGGIHYRRRHGSTGGSSWVLQDEFGSTARLDLVVGIGTDRESGLPGGRLQVEVTEHGGVTSVVLIDTDTAGAEAFYYDDVVRADGTNACAFIIAQGPVGTRSVRITPLGREDGGDCLYRINGIAVYERDPEATAFYRGGEDGAEPFVLSTTVQTFALESRSAHHEILNKVIVVGGRRASVTDSAKFDNSFEGGGQEFHVSVAADPGSIYDPASPNYTGGKRMAVIFDDKVADTAFAEWLARTVLYRQRAPRPAVDIEHTAIPQLELRDPLLCVEERNRSVEQTVWTQSFRERWSLTDGATVQITASGHAELPSFQPREDIDIDRYFPYNGEGQPAVSLSIAYDNIYGERVSNVDLADPAMPGEDGIAPLVQTVAAPVNGLQELPHAAMPDTLLLLQESGTTRRVLTNHPYRRFFSVDGYDEGRPTLRFDFQEGNGDSFAYGEAYYGFPQAGWKVACSAFAERTGRNPFYDPYTSELGKLINVSFDLLVSGFVRVSVWSVAGGRGYEVPVAFLTEPEQPGLEPEAHWAYMRAGRKSLLWDLVDNISLWNRLQSSDYAQELEGAFGDRPMGVGAGYYAWNDALNPLLTQVGDGPAYTDADGVALNYAADGSPEFTVGGYGKFLVRIEVLSDDLMRKSGNRTPRTVSSDALPRTEAGEPLYHETTKAFVWSHLGEPTQVAIRVQDWADSAGPWSEDAGEDGWTDAPDAEATIRDDKPVRFLFEPVPRRGRAFRGDDGTPDPERVSVSLTRQAHLKATVFDQFLTVFAQYWENIQEDNEVGVNKKRVTSRMYHNEEHTVEFVDKAWRNGREIARTRWIFRPELFRKDFGAGIEEALRYADYEQLEGLPGRDAKRGIFNDRSWLLMAYMNQLFYMSAFVMDRSGRRQHCINRAHLDRSKIVTTEFLAATAQTRPEWALAYERTGADRYLVRSIFVRQWKEPGWATGEYNRLSPSPVSLHGITDPWQRHFVQLASSQFMPRAFDVPFDQLPTNQGTAVDRWVEGYMTAGSDINKELQRAVGRSGRTLSGENLIRPPAFGSWTFDRGGYTGFFSPSPIRDFALYWRLPFMADADIRLTYDYERVDVLAAPASNAIKALRDVAAQENWAGRAFTDTYASQGSGRYGAILEESVELWAEKKNRGEALLQAYDYVRQDSLDRWEQYRGVLSRAAYGSRKHGSATYYGDGDKNDRRASVQPVRPAGEYLLNVGRYGRLTVAPQYLGNKETKFLGLFRDPANPETHAHFASDVSLNGVRFRHEYAWYSAPYFPTTFDGFALYGYARSEYTRARTLLPRYWWHGKAEPDTLFYDAGAWAGFKDDAPVRYAQLPDFTGFWTDLHVPQALEWAEHQTETTDSRGKDTDGGSRRFLTGSQPYPVLSADGTTSYIPQSAGDWASSNGAQGTMGFMGSDQSFRKANILDEHFARGKMRLAVCTETPESRDIIMNLTLPQRLR
jgi:hypothetical protein